MKNTLVEGINWVGYVDWTVRDFHSYDTSRGATYNAYLIQDEKTALIDAVKEPYAENLLRHIAELTPLEKVDYIVCNHAEPDHAGAMAIVVEALPQATIICNKKCKAALDKHFDTEGWKFQVVADGETLSLGKRTLQFIDTPMVHWPESMFTYVVEEKILFSMDAFGQHYATSFRFDESYPLDITMYEARTYYANIVMPFGKNVLRTLERVADLDIKMIAPSHGLIWRKDVAAIVNEYSNWANLRPKAKVLVLYDTMWESTEKMGRAILDGASSEGVDAQLIHIRRSNLTHIASEVLEAGALAVGSSTLNGGMMPMMEAVLSYLRGLKPGGKAAFSFGSYGWGKGGPEAINSYFEEMKWEILQEPLRIQFRPTAEVLETCRVAGKQLADRALELAKA